MQKEKTLKFLETKLKVIREAIEVASTDELYMDKLGDIKVPEYLYGAIEMIEFEIGLVNEIIRLRKIIDQR